MSRWARRWPWLLIAAGSLIALYAASAGRTRWVREAFYASIGTRPEPDSFSRRVDHEIRRIQDFARKGRLRDADARLQALFAWPNLSDLDHQGSTVLSVSFRIQAGRTDEADLASFLRPDSHVDVWWLAFQESIAVRKARGDYAATLELLESVVNGRLRHPVQDTRPFPYLENWAADLLVREYLAAGDGPRAHAWARRLKYDFAVDWQTVCGAPQAAEMEDLEELLESSARLAGFTYVKASKDWSARDRRIYGPSWRAIIGLAAFGPSVVLAGIWILQGGSLWRLFWRRRGSVAQTVLAALVAAGGAPQLWLLFVEGGRPSPGTSLWMALLAPAFVLPSIALYGSLFAKPHSSLIGRGANRVAGTVMGSRTTSAVTLNGRSKKKQGASAAVRQQGPPSATYSQSVRTPPKI